MFLLNPRNDQLEGAQSDSLNKVGYADGFGMVQPIGG